MACQNVRKYQLMRCRGLLGVARKYGENYTEEERQEGWMDSLICGKVCGRSGYENTWMLSYLVPGPNSWHLYGVLTMWGESREELSTTSHPWTWMMGSKHQWTDALEECANDLNAIWVQGSNTDSWIYKGTRKSVQEVTVGQIIPQWPVRPKIK